jgi:hypothetical protein
VITVTGFSNFKEEKTMAKLTLGELITKINKKLNFPSLSFDDVDVYLDQAISELNTLLHISIEPMSVIKNNYTSQFMYKNNIVRLESNPLTGTGINIPTVPGTNNVNEYYYNATEDEYMIKNTDGTYSAHEIIYGEYIDPTTLTSTWVQPFLYGNTPKWYPSDIADPTSLNVLHFITLDWWILFVVPYVCAAYAAKDGGNAVLFNDEFAQGFIQLRANYDIQQRVKLTTVMHLPAYKEIADEVLADSKQLINLPELEVLTKAITESMRIPDNLDAEYSDSYINYAERW